MAELCDLFRSGKCPDCGFDKFRRMEDGGHDAVLTCGNCGASFGIQDAPFYFIERVPHG